MTKAFGEMHVPATPIIAHLLLMLTSESWTRSAYTTAYHIFVKIATISYYTSLNWNHCCFYSYTTPPPHHVFQKKAFLTLISLHYFLLRRSWMLLDAECFIYPGVIHTIAWTNLLHCRGTDHTQGTQSLTSEIPVTQIFLYCQFSYMRPN